MRKLTLPSAASIRDALDYNPLTGVLTWRETRCNVVRGQRAGCLKKDGYLYLGLLGQKYLAHRIAWVHFHGTPPVDQIDHRNGITTDNRIENLREACDKLNQQNLQGPTRRNTSGYLGVYPSGKKWRALIQLNGVNHHLGSFATPVEAYHVYLAAKRKHHPYGEIAKLPVWLLPPHQPFAPIV